MTKLSTDWVRIGRSGDTVDGRVIPELALTQAAASYNPELFTALIWPEHQRWENWGKVLALKAEQNAENGTDLYAQLEPNRKYISANTINDEGIFSSIEISPNFRKTGKWYLSGLGATNEPASVGTTEIRFSKQAEQAGILLGNYIPAEIKQFPDDRKDSFFKVFERFFSTEPETDTVSDKYTELKSQIDDLKAKLEGFSKQEPEEKNTSNDETILALTQKNTELEAQLETFKAADALRTTDFNALKTQVETLSISLTAALEEQPSKHSSKNTGAVETAAKLA